MNHQYSLFGKKSLRTLAVIVCSATFAFVIGIQTAGEFHPVASTLADGNDTAGDFNGNGHLDLQDARIALELASGYRFPTPTELYADPNGDFSITTDDVFTILERLERTLSTPKANL